MCKLETFQHKLQKFDPGIVWLDPDNRVIALNGVATQVLGIAADEVIGKNILQFHPEKSRSKVQWLLDSSSCPVKSPPPVTMMINIPDRVLLIKVSKMFKGHNSIGTCMVFFDLTDITTSPHEEGEDERRPRLLFKLPVSAQNKVMLLPLDDIVHLKAEGHYTCVFTRQKQYLCNLSLSDLEGRLEKETFVRIHRSHIVNIFFAKSFQKVDDQCMIVMDTPDETAVPVSRGKVNTLKAMLGLA